jgi:hypothetical protein
MATYMWIGNSNDGSYFERSRTTFDNEEDCYKDMVNEVSEKIKWNTEWCDCREYETIHYDITYSRRKIVHKSYSGIYTYNLIEVSDHKAAMISAITTLLRTSTNNNSKDFDEEKPPIITIDLPEEVVECSRDGETTEQWYLINLCIEDCGKGVYVTLYKNWDDPEKDTEKRYESIHVFPPKVVEQIFNHFIESLIGLEYHRAY